MIHFRSKSTNRSAMRAARQVCIIVMLVLMPAMNARADETITVAAAISLHETADALGQAYKSPVPGERVEFTYGSSGQLMAQIKAGAPIDVFISAGAAQVDDLIKAKLLVDDSRRTVATNQLVLIIPKAANPSEWSRGFETLRDPAVKRIAAGEPKSVPAGLYAQQVLAHLHLVDALADKLVYGTNVRQVLSYVERGEVSAGIVYLTDALQSGDRVKIVATADEMWHEPIEYPAAIVAASTKQPAAQRFLDFLQTPEARTILTSHGFTVPTKPGATTKPSSPDRR